MATDAADAATHIGASVHRLPRLRYRGARIGDV